MEWNANVLRIYHTFVATTFRIMPNFTNKPLVFPTTTTTTKGTTENKTVFGCASSPRHHQLCQTKKPEMALQHFQMFSANSNRVHNTRTVAYMMPILYICPICVTSNYSPLLGTAMFSSKCCGWIYFNFYLFPNLADFWPASKTFAVCR